MSGRTGGLSEYERCLQAIPLAAPDVVARDIIRIVRARVAESDDRAQRAEAERDEARDLACRYLDEFEAVRADLAKLREENANAAHHLRLFAERVGDYTVDGLQIRLLHEVDRLAAPSTTVQPTTETREQHDQRCEHPKCPGASLCCCGEPAPVQPTESVFAGQQEFRKPEGQRTTSLPLEPPTRPEARRWDAALRNYQAEQIVAWVNANGGEARYPSLPPTPWSPGKWGPRIALRRAGGWAYAAPGDWIVKGTDLFATLSDGSVWLCKTPNCPSKHTRDFYPSKTRPTEPGTEDGTT